MKNESVICRGIPLKGIKNARELGGHPTCDGRTVKSGVLLRTASMEGMTREDEAVLTETYRLAHIVDFRQRHEVEKNPEPTIPGVEGHGIDVIEFSSNLDGGKEARQKISSLQMDRDEKIKYLITSGVINDQLYVGFLRGEKGKKGYGQFFRILLDTPEERAVLWHCANGKDRTGIAAMLILGVLGVDRERILWDFMQTNVFFEKEIAATRQRIKGMIEESKMEDAIVLGKGVCERYMVNAIDYLEESYGGISEYVVQELGLTREELQLFRDKYTV